MAHQSLYRTHRPATFADVVGQEQVTKPLAEAARSKTIGHAYLFAGSRGLGKTSVARIFAREIGCGENDLYEIDAASNRGIDDVRAIRDAVSTLPFSSRYKVYIIDEVHMLTKEAFNALLKTLEEPPKHVVFILATTEFEKLPETIISRCQSFTFKKPSQTVLKDLVIRIAKKEGFTLEQASADTIAFLGDGSFRDTHGILQKVISASKDKKISVEEVETIVGAPRGKIVLAFVKAVSEKDAGAGITALHEATRANVDMKVFLKIVLERLRQILLLRYAGELTSAIKEEMTESDFVFAQKAAADEKNGISGATLSEFLAAYDLIRYSAIPELPIELTLIKLFSKGT